MYIGRESTGYTGSTNWTKYQHSNFREINQSAGIGLIPNEMAIIYFEWFLFWW